MPSDADTDVQMAIRLDDLAERYIAGDTKVWSEIVDLGQPWLERQIAVNRLPPGTSAADVIHTTWLRALKRIDRFRRKTPGGFRAWLRTIAQHVIVDGFRRQSHELPATSLDGLASGVAMRRPAGQETRRPSHDLRAEEDRHLLEEVLDRFPEQDRALIRDVYWDGRTPQEVSEARHIPYGTVTSKLTRIRKRLRDVLRQLGFESE